jgi:DNA helicase-2/ATP-dependent DNA helicase PcrA
VQGRGRTHRGQLTRATAAGRADGPPNPFAALNPEQRAAVEHGDEPLLVVAGAGHRQDLTLAARVAHLVLDGADPQRLLLLTFSRRAAAEMQRRAGRLLHQALGLRATQRRRCCPGPAPSTRWAPGCCASWRRGSACARLHGRRPRRCRGPDGSMRAGTGLGLHDTQPLPAGAHLPGHSCRAASTARSRWPQVLAEHFPWCAHGHDALRRLFGAYVAEAKQRQRVLDYDDLLLYWQQALQEPALARAWASASTMCWSTSTRTPTGCRPTILRALKPDGRGVTVVGDDAQAIYGFRAAEVGNMLELSAATLHTEVHRCCRCSATTAAPQPLLDASNAVIALAAAALAKTAVDRSPSWPASRSWCGGRRSWPRPAGWPTRCCASASRARR